MAGAAPDPGLLAALGRLVRGLSALFWGLPLTLLVCLQNMVAEWLRPLGMLPPVMAAALLYYGLVQLGPFQKQERIWQSTLERAKILGLVNLGLTPFLYWWNKLPCEPWFTLAVGLLTLTGLIFLFNLNLVLQRLTAMLPDETLRAETKFFTGLNRYLLAGLVVLLAGWFGLLQIEALPDEVLPVMRALAPERRWLSLFLVLLPVATTMALIWKIKEVIFASVFGKEN